MKRFAFLVLTAGSGAALALVPLPLARPEPTYTMQLIGPEGDVLHIIVGRIYKEQLHGSFTAYSATVVNGLAVPPKRIVWHFSAVHMVAGDTLELTWPMTI